MVVEGVQKEVITSKYKTARSMRDERSKKESAEKDPIVDLSATVGTYMQEQLKISARAENQLATREREMHKQNLAQAAYAAIADESSYKSNGSTWSSFVDDWGLNANRMDMILDEDNTADIRRLSADLKKGPARDLQRYLNACDQV